MADNSASSQWWRLHAGEPAPGARPFSAGWSCDPCFWGTGCQEGIALAMRLGQRLRVQWPRPRCCAGAL